MSNNMYTTVLSNPDLDSLTASILDDLNSKHTDDNMKANTLIATMGHGFNTLLTTMPNVLITGHILTTLLENVTIDDDIKEVAEQMVSFINDLSKEIMNDKLHEMTSKLQNITEKFNKEMQNESTINDEVDTDGSADIS